MTQADPEKQAETAPGVLAQLRLPPEYEARLKDSLPPDYRIPDPVFLAELRRLFAPRRRARRDHPQRRKPPGRRPGA
ncbi:MAG: hypothetical protein ACM3ZA_14505 [Bacillota bacterium]